MLYTPMMYAGGMTDEAREARKKRSLLGTEGTGWDAACAVVFLAGPHARWITGAVLPVDAGATAAIGIGLPKTASVNGSAADEKS
jgi:NAD(P)-dependent dehydrogenase (short-subunit alcohol dehydrogenase family)